MKSPLLVVALLIAMGSWAMAGPSGEVRKRAEKLEKRVQQDASAGTITQDDAQKYTHQLTHITSAMTGESSTTSERRGMWEEMDRIEAALTSAEGGAASPSPSP